MPTDIILAVFASGGFWAFVQFLITRRDGRNEEIMEISRQLKELSERVSENQAILARTHILRFSDEISNGIGHSLEYYRQQLQDCDTYQRFCETHPNFRNSYTETASEHIQNTYAKLLAKGEFKMK